MTLKIYCQEDFFDKEEAVTSSGAGDAMRHAEDKVQGMRSKADATDSLMDAGVLNDLLDNRSRAEKELSKLRTGSAVDIELEKLNHLAAVTVPRNINSNLLGRLCS